MYLKDEVGMAGSKITQTRFVGIITFTIHPYACFSLMHLSMVTHWCYPYTKLNIIVRMWEKFTIISSYRGWGVITFDHVWVVSLIPAPTKKESVGM